MEEKVNNFTYYKAEELGMDEVKQIDDKMRSYHKDTVCEFEAQSYAQRNAQ